MSDASVPAATIGETKDATSTEGVAKTTGLEEERHTKDNPENVTIRLAVLNED